jgi:hypothetical protein
VGDEIMRIETRRSKTEKTTINFDVGGGLNYMIIEQDGVDFSIRAYKRTSSMSKRMLIEKVISVLKKYNANLPLYEKKWYEFWKK